MLTKRPRMAAGEISAMYIGETTEASPMATPATMRKALNSVMLRGRAVPTAAIANSNAASEERLLASPPVTDGPGEERRENAANLRAANREAHLVGTQGKLLLKENDGARNHRQIVAK